MGHKTYKPLNSLTLAAHIVLLSGVVTIGATYTGASGLSIFKNTAQAQYFIRQKTDEEKAAEDTTETEEPKTRSRGFTLRPKNTPGSDAKIEQRTINPLYAPTIVPKREKEEQEEPEQAQPSPDIPRLEDYVDPRELVAQVTHELGQSLGGCSEEDKKFLKRMAMASQQTQEQTNKLTETVQSFDSTSILDSEELKKFAEHVKKTGEIPEDMPTDKLADSVQTYQETGKLPESIQKMIDNQKKPSETINEFQKVQESMDFEQYTLTAIRCASHQYKTSQ